MARKQTQAAETGTSRVVNSDGFVIPGPTLPDREEVQSEAKPKAKAPTDRTAQNAPVPPISLSLAQNRLSRLRALARRNRDVAWLLNEKLSKSEK